MVSSLVETLKIKSIHHENNKNHHTLSALGVFLLVAVVATQALLQTPSASAEQIAIRSLKLEAADLNPGGLNGGSRPSGALPNVNSTANHTFTFTLPSITATPVGSLLF